MATTTATTTLQQLINAIGQKAGDKLAGASTEMQSGGGELLSGFLGIDWSAPTWDILILIFFVLSVLVYSFTLGRDRIVAILIATYLALAVTTNLPFLDVATEYINSFGAVAYRLSAFLIVFILLFILLTRSQFIQGLSSLDCSWWQVILFGLLQAGLFTSIVLSLLPAEALPFLSEYTRTIFFSDLGRFCWVALPILALVFFNRPKRRRHSRRDYYRQRLEDFDFDNED